MKRPPSGRAVGASLPASVSASRGRDVSTKRPRLSPLRPGEITARGWLRAQLELSLRGLGGHLGEIEPDQMEKPYVTRDFDPANGARGLVGWCAEMGAEFPLGQATVAYALGDETLLAKTEWRIRSAMALQEPDGYLGAYRPGDDRHEDFNGWGSHIFYRLMLLEYARTGDKAILDAVHRGLLWFAENWSGDRKTDYAGPTILIPAAEVFRLTGDVRLRAFCEDYAAWLDKPGRLNGATLATFPLETHAYHVAGLAARLQVPVALAANLDRPDWLDSALKMLSAWRDGLGWQCSYTPCADGEWTAAPSCVGESEYCDHVYCLELFQRLAALTGDPAWSDAIERLVFNAAQGARAKDERTIGYMTSPNQWYATLRSSLHGPEPHYGVYAPNQNAACCPANSIRLYPLYILGAVLRESDDLCVMNYGPMAVNTAVDGAKVLLDIDTEYPFDGRVTLRVRADGWRGSLRLRRPAWASGVEVRRSPGRDAPTARPAGGRFVETSLPNDAGTPGRDAPTARPAGGRFVETSLPESRNSIIVLPGPWGAEEETIEIIFSWAPVLKAVRDRDFPADAPLRTIEWGALVFSQPVEERWTPVSRPAPTWGEDHSPPQPAEWPWLDVEPVREPVSYALPANLDPAAIRVERTADGDPLHPWQKPPVRVRVPMVHAEAAYPLENRGGPHTPIPAASIVAPDPGTTPQNVVLVPFGATTLRTTCFPTA